MRFTEKRHLKQAKDAFDAAEHELLRAAESLRILKREDLKALVLNILDDIDTVSAKVLKELLLKEYL